ncbi:MAG: hypothetical protein WA110_03115 [Anaerolineaceae bacterium]
MNENKPLTALNRLSIVIALVTLALGFTYIIPTASNPSMTNLLGFLINVNIDVYSFVPVFISILAFAGTLWVLKSNPFVIESKATVLQLTANVMLPVFSVLVLSITLREMSRNEVWWVVYILGAFLFGLVVIAEYTVLDISKTQHPLATIGLIGLSHALFLILTIVLKTSNMRLYLVLPVLLLACAFVSVRTINLRLNGSGNSEYVVLVCLIIVQLAIAFYYLFLNPIQYGLLLTGVLYAILSFACGLITKLPKRDLLTEPLVMAVITLAMVVIVGLN